MPAHPCGIQPEGQLLLFGAKAVNTRAAGLGRLHVLSDAVMLDVLGLLSPAELALLACCSHACYAFADSEDLWKAHVLETFEGRFTWSLTWRDTYAASLRSQQQGSSNQTAAAAAPHQQQQAETAEEQQQHGKARKRSRLSKAAACPPRSKQQGWDVEALAERVRRAVQVKHFYSDLLYQPWHCATLELPEEWLQVDNVPRRSGLSAQEFREQFEAPNQPVVLSDGASDWPALRKWDMPALLQAFGDTQPVIVGNMEMPLSTYVAYGSSTLDEMPLYLFDKGFASAASSLQHDFHVPAVFTEDLLGALGEGKRPDYRWLIAGPQRSGSSFHIDPNATSAWNAVVAGRKKWILFPPGVVPPGVHPSVDGANVATPVSIIEWFLNNYEAARNGKVTPLECVCRPGDVMFVPSGWWHACINLDTWTIAVTQNFVSSVNLRKVLEFLQSGNADLVSGCTHDERGSLHDRFVAALRQSHPAALEAVEAARREAERKAQEARKLTALFSKETAAAKQQPGASTGSQEPTGGFAFRFSF